MYIVAGRVDLLSKDGLALDVKSLHIHPDWIRNSGTLVAGDIALIQISSKASISSTVGT